jgi:hypothetical protein
MWVFDERCYLPDKKMLNNLEPVVLDVGSDIKHFSNTNQVRVSG